VNRRRLVPGGHIGLIIGSNTLADTWSGIARWIAQCDAIEVQAAIAGTGVVVVGMAQNPYPKRARKSLAAAGIPFKYLEYGSYFNDWRRRNALKMWTGWPTMPMVFVNGVLIGGAQELDRLIASGELLRMLQGT
jgi:glutaredoxin-related protein